MLKHLLNYWQTHRQRSPYIVTDDPLFCKDLSSGSSRCQEIYTVSRVNPLYTDSGCDDVNSYQSESGDYHLDSNPNDVNRWECLTCGSSSPKLSYQITKTFAEIHHAPSFLHRKISLPFTKEMASDVEGVDVSTNSPLNKNVTNNIKELANNSFSSQIKNAYKRLCTKRERNGISSGSQGPVSSETEDSGVQTGSSISQSEENIKVVTTETAGETMCSRCCDTSETTVTESINLTGQKHTQSPKPLSMKSENVESFLYSFLDRVRERKQKEESDKQENINQTETLESVTKEPENTNEADEQPQEKNLEKETVSKSEPKSSGESLQAFSKPIEQVTNQTLSSGEALKSRTDKNQQTGLATNSFERSSCVQLTKPSYSEPKSLNKDNPELMKDVNCFTKRGTNNEDETFRETLFSQERHNDGLTSEKNTSFLKLASNNSSSSDCLSGCPFCDQATPKKQAVQTLTSEVTKRDIRFSDSANSGLSSSGFSYVDCRTINQESKKEEKSARVPGQIRLKTTSNLCRRCAAQTKNQETKKYEEYYRCLPKSGGRQRPEGSEQCHNCQKRFVEYFCTTCKNKTMASSGHRQRVSPGRSRLTSSMDHTMKHSRHSPEGSSVESFVEVDRKGDQTDQDRTLYREHYSSHCNNKVGQEQSVHRTRTGSSNRGFFRGRGHWDDSLLQCTCEEHSDNYFQQRRVTFAEDVQKRESQPDGDNPKQEVNSATHPRNDTKPVLLNPTRLHPDSVIPDEDESVMSSLDFLGYGRFQPNLHTHQAQSEDLFRSYPCDVDTWQTFLRNENLRKRRKRALFMGVMAITIILAVGIAVAVILSSLRRKHANIV
ncbi:uncharacterized protein LOC143243329 [Tachypleus tridentatus]|uniref:uncharacterized protein LOC143243329 n=1 Tax=Tachypleus tridentatus TaxID=6853 RepID=UPI003FD19D3B